ncbi:MAG: hypothetical protein WD825_11985 [Gemmatimonadaceae bacterium]
MRPHGVVGEPEISGQLLDGIRTRAQQRDDAPARAVMKPLVQGCAQEASKYMNVTGNQTFVK